MITKDLKKLLEKLNDHTTRSLEAAAGFCIGRGHYEVSIEHLFLKLLEDGAGDVPRIFNHFNVDSGALWDAMLKRLEGFRAGNSGRPTMSPILLQFIEAAWITSSIHHGFPEIRSGNLLEALLESEGLWTQAYSDVLTPIRGEDLRQNFFTIVAGSAEDIPAKLSAARQEREMEKPKREGETALDLYTTDMTGNARAGKIDPVFGRDKEIRQMIDILSRRRKNNPILVGEAGVGKTAVVEGLALRITQGDVPSSLIEVDIRGLDLGLLQAGAGVKGEFENRLKSVIAQVKEAAKPIILFIDEAHTLIGAGGAAGTSDAANLLKPALARGELRTVAATTWSEYKKYFEKDAALERRFQMVKVDEPSVEVATSMMRGIKSKYEKHHNIQISDEAISTAVKLAERFISGRQLPDKAVDLLDTSAARVRMGQTAKPAALDDVERRLQNLDIKIAAITRDLDTGVLNDVAALTALQEERKQVDATRGSIAERWKKESDHVTKITGLRAQLTEMNNGDGKAKRNEADAGKLKKEIDQLKKELETIQGEEPLVHVEVDGSIAAEVVADWTGIPVGSMMKDEAQVLLAFEDKLKTRILGQEEAITDVADTIRTAKAGMRNPEAPIGVFLFVGPSGVGKTECARVVADQLFGGERFVITINMSEYQESHTVSQLKGSPPGYVGYGEGGVLTEAVRQRPYSVVLLDEVEKAHRDVLNLFYQVFDKGFMRDGEGREIDFKNTIIMMTSNLGSDIFMQVCTEDERPTADQLREALHPTLVNHFQAALLARMKVVPFYPLRKETMKGIVKLKLGQIAKRLNDAHAMAFDYDPVVIDRVAERCTQIDTGARNIDFIIDRTLLPEVSKAMITKMAEEKMPAKLTLGMDEKGNFTYVFA